MVGAAGCFGRRGKEVSSQHALKLHCFFSPDEESDVGAAADCFRGKGGMCVLNCTAFQPIGRRGLLERVLSAVS
jgi:hypothetical protein